MVRLVWLTVRTMFEKLRKAWSELAGWEVKFLTIRGIAHSWLEESSTSPSAEVKRQVSETGQWRDRR